MDELHRRGDAELREARYVLGREQLCVLDPLTGIRAGLLRTQDEREAWHPEQALTVEQALATTCVTPAWLERAERRRGKLLPGYLADLVVLSSDPVEKLAECEVVATMVGGRWVHNPPPWA